MEEFFELIVPAVLIAGVVVWIANMTRNTFEHHKFIEWDDQPVNSEDF